MLTDAAINWVRANCADPKVRADFARTLKDVMQRRMECWFAIGQALTRQRVPFMIHCFAGELFIFQLNSSQAQSLLLAPNALLCSSDPRPAPPSQRALPAVMALSNLELDRPILSSNDRITGSFDYEMTGELPAAYCLRLDYSLGLSGDATSWNIPEQLLSASGQFRFSFDRLADSKWPFTRSHQGPMALFLRVCTLPPSGEMELRRPISNACGALVQIEQIVAPPPRGLS